MIVGRLSYILRETWASFRRNVTLTVGVQAETRITPKATTPACPFPAQLELVPPMDNGKLAVGVPIDVPFTDINKILEAQLKGHHYPEDKDAALEELMRTWQQHKPYNPRSGME